MLGGIKYLTNCDHDVEKEAAFSSFLYTLLKKKYKIKKSVYKTWGKISGQGQNNLCLVLGIELYYKAF